MYQHYGMAKKRPVRELPALDRWLLQLYAEHRIRYFLLVASVLTTAILLPILFFYR